MTTGKKALAIGAAGGVAATVAIDVVTVAVMPLMGLPWNGGFTVIADTAAGFFALVGMNVAGGVLPGAIVHYVVGLALGALFGAAAARIRAFQPGSVLRGIGLGILYTEIVSLPILVTPPLILRWSLAEAAQWFAFSFVMHAIWGATLGAVVAYGLATARRQRPDRLHSRKDAMTSG